MLHLSNKQNSRHSKRLVLSENVLIEKCKNQIDSVNYKYIVKTIHKAYKFRLEPNAEQKVLLAKHFGCVRFVYNYFLSERKRQYDKSHKSDTYYEQAKKLTELKNDDEHLWLKEINSQTLQHALRHLETAYVNFFKKRAKFPNFKSRIIPSHPLLGQHPEDARIQEAPSWEVSWACPLTGSCIPYRLHSEEHFVPSPVFLLCH